jgi:Flp pilus assembly protein TadG
MDTIKLKTIGNNRGLALVYVALAIMVLIGFIGLAFDLSYLYVVKGELQNAADATALAGAGSLYKDPLNPGETPALNFPRASAAATSFVGQNKTSYYDSGASLRNLTDAQVSTGYWTSPSGVQVPAVFVTINRSAGNNGGAVTVFFAKILPGVASSAPVTASATAAQGYPGSAPGEILFPIALSSCMTDQYFSQNPLPSPPTTIVFSSPYTPGGSGCYTGQWTSFKLDNNDVPTIRDLITNGSPTPLNTGDNIWIEPGAKASLYGFVNSWLPAGGKDVLMPIIDGTTGITTHAEMAIKGFATFHIVSADQSAKTVTGYFINYTSEFPGTTPGGSVSNTITPPVMVQ